MFSGFKYHQVYNSLNLVTTQGKIWWSNNKSSQLLLTKRRLEIISMGVHEFLVLSASPCTQRSSTSKYLDWHKPLRSLVFQENTK